MASVHGGVRPVCQQGSRVTKRVPLLAAPPACRKALTSACGPPTGAVAPTPTTRPDSDRTTAPTHGFGEVRVRAVPATSIARRMSASSSLSARASIAPRSKENSVMLRAARGHATREQQQRAVCSPALIRTFTVGSGVSPDRPLPGQRFAGCTAGRELHPTPQEYKLCCRAYRLSSYPALLVSSTSSRSPVSTL